MDEKTSIRAICEKYNLSPTALANQFGIPVRTAQQWYAGDRTPPVYVVNLIKQSLEQKQKNKSE